MIAVDCIGYRLEHAKTYEGVGDNVLPSLYRSNYEIDSGHKFDATNIIPHKLSLSKGRHAYSILDKKE